MRSQLAQHFQSIREQNGLSLAQLSRMIGYTNATKGCNKILKFEQRGEIHADLLRKLADALGIADSTIDALIEEDRQRFFKLWNEWANQPIQPHLVIRWIPAVYQSKELSESVKTLEEAERVAAETARHWRKRVCLVWSRRQSVWLDEEGKITTRTEAAPGVANVPTMRLKGGKRHFVLDHPAAGGMILRIVNWPTNPTSAAIHPGKTEA